MKRGRGRPPKQKISRSSSNCESDSEVPESDVSVRRKRRSDSNISTPRGVSRQILPTPEKIPMSRRSQRRNIDINKTMIVAFQDSDLRSIFDIKSEQEWEQLQLALKEDHSAEWSDDDDSCHGTGSNCAATVGMKQEVLTPSVKITAQPSSSHFDFDGAKRAGPITGRLDHVTVNTPSANPNPSFFGFHSHSTTPVVSSYPGNGIHAGMTTSSPITSYDYSPYKYYSETYFDFDLNQEDMNYFDAMKQRLLTSSTFENFGLQKEFTTCMNEIMNYRLFELMISRLEKELELAISSLNHHLECQSFSESLKDLHQQIATLNTGYLQPFFEGYAEEPSEMADKFSAEPVVKNPVQSLREFLEFFQTSEARLLFQRQQRHRVVLHQNLCNPLVKESFSSQPAAIPSTSYRRRADSVASVTFNSLPPDADDIESNPTTTPKSISSKVEELVPCVRPCREDFTELLSKEQSTKALLPLVNRYIIERNSFRYLLPHTSTSLTASSCTSNYPTQSSGNLVNSRVPYKQLIGGEIEVDWNFLDPKYVNTILAFCSEVYDYWLSLRCSQLSKFSSLLRAYHNFIMPLWERCSEANLPSISDYGKDPLVLSHKQLHLIRDDLNRARLIIDRVRRREKLKKDLIKCSNENLVSNILLVDSKPIELVLGRAATDHSANSIDLATTNLTSLLSPSQPKRDRKRSLSLMSDSSHGFGSVVASVMPVRKRGRPRTVNPFLGNSGSQTDGSFSSTPINTDRIAKSEASTQVKFVQGRDKFGKFLKKQAIVFSGSADLPKVQVGAENYVRTMVDSLSQGGKEGTTTIIITTANVSAPCENLSQRLGESGEETAPVFAQAPPTIQVPRHKIAEALSLPEEPQFASDRDVSIPAICYSLLENGDELDEAYRKLETAVVPAINSNVEPSEEGANPLELQARSSRRSKSEKKIKEGRKAPSKESNSTLKSRRVVEGISEPILSSSAPISNSSSNIFLSELGTSQPLGCADQLLNYESDDTTVSCHSESLSLFSSNASSLIFGESDQI